MRRLVDASRVRIPVPVRSRPRWSRRIPTRIAHGIGHDHAWVFMDSIGNKAVSLKLAESAPKATLQRQAPRGTHAKKKARGAHARVYDASRSGGVSRAIIDLVALRCSV